MIYHFVFFFNFRYKKNTRIGQELLPLGLGVSPSSSHRGQKSGGAYFSSGLQQLVEVLLTHSPLHSIFTFRSD